MANYSTVHYEKNGRYFGEVTVDIPPMGGLPNGEKQVIKFEAASLKELDLEITKYIVKINNNL